MKKIILYLLLFFVQSQLMAQKKPAKVGIIKEFTGTVTNSSSWDYIQFFTLKDLKIGSIEFYFSTEMNDKYKLDCNISDELYNELTESNANGKKVKVKAKSTYGVFDNLSSEGPSEIKLIIWRPIEVTEL